MTFEHSMISSAVGLTFASCSGTLSLLAAN